MPLTTLTRPAPTSRTATDRSVIGGVAALAVVSLGGALLAVTTGLSPTVWQAMGPTGRLSIPVPMMVAQLVLGVLASGTRRRPALVSSLLLAIVEPVCVVSGFFDGGYSDPARSTVHVIYQAVFVAAIVVVGVLAARRFFRLR